MTNHDTIFTLQLQSAHLILIYMGNKQNVVQASTQNQNAARLKIQSLESNDDKFLKPITFQEFGEPPQQQSRPRQPNQSSLKSPNSSRYVSVYSSMRSARLTQMQLKMNQLTVINEQDHPYSNIKIDENLTIPFSVVRLKIDKDVMKSIKELQPDFLMRYEGLNRNPQQQWKINSKTYYYKMLSENEIAITKPGFFYEGGFVQKENNILPDRKGTLFTDRGMYKGQFCEGEAHGLGTFTDRVLRSQYQGKWINGQMANGTIQNQHYAFQGHFKKNLADGKGAIHFKKDNSSYQGLFRDGLYQDENGYFSSKEYDYSGGFKEGKKSGSGCLIQKERNIKSKNKRYKPQQEFDGEFENDCYKGKKKI